MKKITRNTGLVTSVIGWLILAAVLLVLLPMVYRAELPMEYHFYHSILFILLFGIYYLNVKILLPKIYEKKGLLIYVLCLITLSFGTVFTMNFIEDQLKLQELLHNALKPDQPYVPKSRSFLISLYIFILTALMYFIGIASRLVKKWNREEKKNIILQEQKSKAELSTLKAQINPHFFFNTLNTIYSLTFYDVGKSQEALLKLSKMMRYVMNEENLDKVKLKDEITFIRNYVDLMKERLPENVILKTDFPDVNESTEIAPMILLTFVENCFKHGVSANEPCEIDIVIHEKEGILHLKTQNRIFTSQNTENSSGIGIENTLKRLEILYPEKFEYFNENKNGNYFCNLKIDLR